MIENLGQSYSPYITDLADLQNGVILCDVVNLLIYNGSNDVLSNEVYIDDDMTDEECV